MSRMIQWALLAFITASLLVAEPGFSKEAEIRRLEVVGAVALHGRGHPRDTPKDRAVQEGLINGVTRVGADLLLEGLLLAGDPNTPAQPESPLPDLLAGTTLTWESPVSLFMPAQELEMERVRKALGRDMVPYTRGFRILEDQGERPALFTQDPDAATEYVVVMEVQVEVGRVRQQLEKVGLIQSAPLNALTGIELELSGVREYALYQAILDLLAQPGIEAASVVPESFYAQHARLRVEGAWTPSELNRLLHSAAPAELSLTSVAVQDAEESNTLWPWQASLRPRLALAVSWRPPTEESTLNGTTSLDEADSIQAEPETTQDDATD
ncbi:MAG: hypothetical protein VX252_02420 [Myxococcota bacterium]|nr:hypothetical protein [Myxococcota bacterium]